MKGKPGEKPKDSLIEELRALVAKLKGSRAHTYASENAAHYRGFDAGQLRAGEALEIILRRNRP